MTDNTFAPRKVTDDTPHFQKYINEMNKPASDRVWFVFVGVAVASAAFIIGSLIVTFIPYSANSYTTTINSPHH